MHTSLAHFFLNRCCSMPISVIFGVDRGEHCVNDSQGRTLQCIFGKTKAGRFEKPLMWTESAQLAVPKLSAFISSKTQQTVFVLTSVLFFIVFTGLCQNGRKLWKWLGLGLRMCRRGVVWGFLRHRFRKSSSTLKRQWIGCYSKASDTFSDFIRRSPQSVKIARCARCSDYDFRRSPRSAYKIADIWHVRYRRLNSPEFAKCARSRDFLRSSLQIASKVNQSGWAILSHEQCWSATSPRSVKKIARCVRFNRWRFSLAIKFAAIGV